MNYKPSFADYLIANGWHQGTKSEFSETDYFFKGDLGVMISGDSVDFGRYNNSSIGGQRLPGCQIYAAFTGISNLTDFDWMLLLHIAGAVHLKDFVSKAAAIIPEANAFASNIKTAFDPHTNKTFAI